MSIYEVLFFLSVKAWWSRALFWSAAQWLGTVAVDFLSRHIIGRFWPTPVLLWSWTLGLVPLLWNPDLTLLPPAVSCSHSTLLPLLTYLCDWQVTWLASPVPYLFLLLLTEDGKEERPLERPLWHLFTLIMIIYFLILSCVPALSAVFYGDYKRSEFSLRLSRSPPAKAAADVLFISSWQPVLKTRSLSERSLLQISQL